MSYIMSLAQVAAACDNKGIAQAVWGEIQWPDIEDQKLRELWRQAQFYLREIRAMIDAIPFEEY